LGFKVGLVAEDEDACFFLCGFGEVVHPVF
jgi:hypothetical protein